MGVTNMNRLTDQVAIVTGGAAGIGGSTSRRLAEEGAKVLIVDINEETSNANIEQIRAGGGTAEFFNGDVGKHENIQGMVQKAVELWGRLDSLMNLIGALGNSLSERELFGKCRTPFH